jgi:16S rRNA (adenine1518-N6/adenine1519-N6)-dimethyltransferase
MAPPLVRFEDPRAVLKRHGLRPKHTWGQNFLVSPKALSAIANAAASPQPTPKRIIEIGAGVGTLTAALLDLGVEVVAIERDREMCEVLRQEFGSRQGFELLEADAAKIDYRSLIRDEKPVIAGNLPYQLTGRLLRAIIDMSRLITRAVVMVQEEVARRLAAPAAHPSRGALSVIAQSRFSVKTVLRLKSTAFYPPPKVRSTVICLIPSETWGNKDAGSASAFDALVHAAFTNRRKTIRNSLITAGYSRPTEIAEALARAGIDPGIRPERLTQADFLRLLEAFI